MPDPYLGEIRIFPFHFAPRGWAQCNGQVLPINQYQALFSILGTTYGGNGLSTFALPNLMGRVPVHYGNDVALGQVGGEEAHTLTVPELPEHTHTVQGSSLLANQASPAGNVWADAENLYSKQANASMNVVSVQASGSGMPHANMQPYGVVNICIALTGVYPARS
ncbi:phage tail protein [Alicyclobacillus fodiniaquatilis]|jgi:microcystin-dependent protein|uniref:Phage tail protein n=1 Tax=Alicyclobacillus fodiniaquatilis TaxID=1661150 RepID=A0ABW4JII7_9BACL